MVDWMNYGLASSASPMSESKLKSSIAEGDKALAVRTLCSSILAHPSAVAWVAVPYLPVAGAFIAFLHWNGGIVLGPSTYCPAQIASDYMLTTGDKSMHIAVLHLPQMCYFAAFSAAMASPILLPEPYLFRSTIRAAFGTQ